jgi:hypothetical protein
MCAGAVSVHEQQEDYRASGPRLENGEKDTGTGRSSPTGRAEECLEYRNATDAGTAVLKGSTYLLLKNSENLADEERPRLRALLELNQALSTTYLVKEDLKRL